MIGARTPRPRNSCGAGRSTFAKTSSTIWPRRICIPRSARGHGGRETRARQGREYVRENEFHHLAASDLHPMIGVRTQRPRNQWRLGREYVREKEFHQLAASDLYCTINARTQRPGYQWRLRREYVRETEFHLTSSVGSASHDFPHDTEAGKPVCTRDVSTFTKPSTPIWSRQICIARST